MSSFDDRARDWDKDKMHMDRSIAIAAAIEKTIPLNKNMKALEYGAGTGILSFLLKDKFSEIILMDSSQEMINVCNEKVDYYKSKHIKPLWYDLEHNDYPEKFDFIYHQMVLHHVTDVDAILTKFYSLINSGGYIVIADLYTEDGSFHGPEVKVHLGFDPEKLARQLTKIGFHNITNRICFSIERPNGNRYPVFLLTAMKG